MSNLIDFLNKLGSDPKALAAYEADPESAMAAANLTDDEKSALRAGDVEKIKEATGLDVKMTQHSISSYK